MTRPGSSRTETPTAARPILILFTTNRDGRSRRTDGHLAQVLQRRHNHDTFAIKHVALEDHPDLFEKFQITETPSLVVVDERRVKGRLTRPQGCEEIKTFLNPWLK